MSDSTSLRTVLFLTTLADEEMPLQEATPACLLPFGHASFAERTLESLAAAGIRHVDLVVCEQPEALRERLKDGWRWGIDLTWHLAFDTNTPYDIISRLARSSPDRLLIGHADCWVGTPVVEQLMQQNFIANTVGEHPYWSGWLSMNTDEALSLPAYIDAEGWAHFLPSLGADRTRLLLDDQYASAANAQHLLEAQHVAFSHPELIPATWIRQPWGAASPDAIIHEQAIIHGPVLIGPRCSIGRGAEVGPGVVLSNDILVSGGALVKHSVVLPDTYISASIDVEDLIVKGRTFTDLKRLVKYQMPKSDGLLDDLHQNQQAPATPLSRGLGLLCFGLLSPLMLPLLLWQSLHGRTRGPWITEPCVHARNEDGTLAFYPIRFSIPGNGLTGALLGFMGGMLDVVQGHRSWLGIRPRNAAEWYSLRKQWQTLFSNEPIGLFNAPDWDDPSHPSKETQAAADAYLIVRPGWKKRLHLLQGIVSQFRLGQFIRQARAR